MAKVFIDETILSAIGDAIRSKTGEEDLIPPANMAEQISSIVGGITVHARTQEITTEYDSNRGCAYSTALELKNILVNGETYIVVLDGVEYECTCRDIPFTAGAMNASLNTCIGNAHVLKKTVGYTNNYTNDEDTGEPFLITAGNTTSDGYFNTTNAGTYTVKIYKKNY